MNLLTQRSKTVDLQFALALSAILIAIFTWMLDLSDLVVHCVYCRTSRTVIGAMGLLMLSPFWHTYWIRLLFYPLAFLGAHVAAAQIFLHIQHANIWKSTFLLSSSALFIILGLVMFMLAQQPPRVSNTPKVSGNN